MKQEEIEKLGEDYVLNEFDEDEDEYIKSLGYNGFVSGVELVQSQFYSEAEVKNLFKKYFKSQGMGEYQSMDFDIWFELSKKK